MVHPNIDSYCDSNFRTFLFIHFSTIMEDSSKKDFSIEGFLKEAGIEENDILKYVAFLKKWGLKGERDLTLLAGEEGERRLKTEANDYKLQNSDFNFTRRDIQLKIPQRSGEKVCYLLCRFLRIKF